MKNKSGQLVSATHQSIINESEIYEALYAMEDSGNLNAEHTVDTYKIIYKTKNVDGEIINVSGLISIPFKAEDAPSPILSLQHGTAFLDSQVPSENDGAGDIRTIAASMGYIVVAADYIGYVESSHLMHPYTHAETLASSVIDMLKASKTFLKNEGILFNEQLFLAGYSEGGYATIAAQKSIQESYADELKVTASASGAGPYDVLSTAKIAASANEMAYPAYIAFVVKAYNDIYSLDKLADIIQPPYLETMNEVFNGTHAGEEINELIPHKPSELFTAEFLQMLKGGTEPSFSPKMQENNIYNWIPNVPTHFYHGRDDQIVPYSNTQIAVETMQKLGAKDISLTDCKAGELLTDHVNCGLPFYSFMFTFFNTYAKDI